MTDAYLTTHRVIALHYALIDQFGGAARRGAPWVAGVVGGLFVTYHMKRTLSSGLG